jgi:hypothetical protein
MTLDFTTLQDKARARGRVCYVFHIIYRQSVIYCIYRLQSACLWGLLDDAMIWAEGGLVSQNHPDGGSER